MTPQSLHIYQMKFALIVVVVLRVDGSLGIPYFKGVQTRESNVAGPPPSPHIQSCVVPFPAHQQVMPSLTICDSQTSFPHQMCRSTSHVNSYW